MIENLQARYGARRRLLATVDDAGHPIVRVELKGGQYAVCDRGDFDRLMRLGVSPNWFINSNGRGNSYVRANVPDRFGWDNIVMVARLVKAPAVRKVVVRYVDRDPLNLRAANLELGTGWTAATAWECHALREQAQQIAASQATA